MEREMTTMSTEPFEPLAPVHSRDLTFQIQRRRLFKEQCERLL